MPENKIINVKQYWYAKDRKNKKVLSNAVIVAVDKFTQEFRTNRITIFIRGDEYTPEDDFGDLYIILMRKGLQPQHFQIGPVPKREPVIFTGERIPL